MNDKKNHALCYFHAYGKVCLTISAQRIWRAPSSTASMATRTIPKAKDAYATHIWAVGMALCLPTNRDIGTRKRGNIVAGGRSYAQLESSCFAVDTLDTLPEGQIEWNFPIDQTGSGPGRFLMNEDALDHLLSKLRLMEHKSKAGVVAVDAMIGGGLDPILINTLKRLRKLAAAHDGSAGLYKAYKEVFNTGSL